MTAVAALQASAELAFTELLDCIKDIDEHKSWASVAPLPEEYFHSNGSIVGIVQHIAACRMLYASFAFRQQELRGRAILDRMKSIATSWEESKAFLSESQQYWMDSWSSLSDDQLEHLYGTIWATEWPAWKLIGRVTQHDQYHAGQIQLIRAIAPASNTPPDMMFELEEKYARESPTW